MSDFSALFVSLFQAKLRHLLLITTINRATNPPARQIFHSDPPK